MVLLKNRPLLLLLLLLLLRHRPAPDVTEVVADIDGAEAPIAAVAGASLGAYVAIRVWKLVRRAI